MAWSEITVIAPTRDATVTNPPTALTGGTGWYFTAPKAGKFMFTIDQATGADRSVTICAGNGISAGMGARTVTMLGTSTIAGGPISLSRHKSNSSICLLCANTLTANIRVFKLP